MTEQPADPRLADLRSQLSALIDFPWLEQCAMLVQMYDIYPHSVRPVSVDHEVTHEQIHDFTCFAYAFQLHRWPEFFERNPNVVALDGPMVSVLLDGAAEKAHADIVDGDLAIYYTDRAVHAGIVRGSLVRSKWGTGYIWDHGTFEVPAQHGSVVRYFSAPALETTIARFQGHAERQIRALNEPKRHGR